MKKFLFMLALVAGVALSAGAAPSGDDRYSDNVRDLPQAAQSFLARYFGNHKVGVIKIDAHLIGADDYEVRLVNGSEVDFDRNGNWESVDCGRTAVPAGIVPQGIRRYVARNGRGAVVTSIEKKRGGGYEVELSDGIELTFDRNLACTRIDKD